MSADLQSAFTACFILAGGAADSEQILTEVRCYVDFNAAINPLSRGPILAIDIPQHDLQLSERTHLAGLAETLHKLPCGAIPEWLVPRRDAPRAFGLYATWDEMAAHPGLVDLERSVSDDQ